MIFDQVLMYSFPLCTQNKLYNRMNIKALMFSGYNTGNNTLLNARFANTFVERSFVAVNLATVCYQKKEKEINKNWFSVWDLSKKGCRKSGRHY